MQKWAILGQSFTLFFYSELLSLLHSEPVKSCKSDCREVDKLGRVQRPCRQVELCCHSGVLTVSVSGRFLELLRFGPRNHQPLSVNFVLATYLSGLLKLCVFIHTCDFAYINLVYLVRKLEVFPSQQEN